jgi:microcystin-dependent protein
MGETPFLGEIMLFAGNFPPRGWAFCNGQLLAISQNNALFALIGTTYGGDGVNTFGLPNMQSRVPVHMGQGTGLSPFVIGELTGTESVTLNVNQIPQHTHTPVAMTIGVTDTPANEIVSSDPGGNVAQYKAGAANSAMAPTAIAPAGSNQPHPNIQPVLCLSFCIALFGVFPSRN